MSWGAIGGAVAGAVVSSTLSGGHGGAQGAQQAAGAADPFASQRPQYQQQLSDLLSGKTPFIQTPGAAFAKQQGLDAITAHANATGHAGSGNELIALDKYATGFAEQQYQQQVQNLMALAGVGAGSPGTAGGILGQQSAADQFAIDAFGSKVGGALWDQWGIGGVGYAGSSEPTNMTGFQTPPPPTPWSTAPAAGGASFDFTSFF